MVAIQDESLSYPVQFGVPRDNYLKEPLLPTQVCSL